MNGIKNTRMNEALYVTLCHKIGFPTSVTIRRQMADLKERIYRLKSMETKHMMLRSGSDREGFRLIGSDIDWMFWPTDHKIIWDYKQSRLYHSSDTTLIMMQCCDDRPGFALLHLLTDTKNRYVQSACVKIYDDFYISSSIYKERTMTLMKLKSLTIHGPCASGRLAGGLEYDNAHCFSCDFWPPFASTFVERSQIKGWPSSSVLQEILDNGCHFVPIGRRNSPMELHEWRISFSVAEQKLVYAMNHCQFLCYGILKIFLKEVLNCNTEEPLLCSYFLKTILFWQIQEQEIPIWTPHNILHCTWQCIKHLIKLVYRGECPNFFIHANNMFYDKIVGSARIRLLSQLYELYNEGLSCVLKCPSILRNIETLIVHNTKHALNINENLWFTTTDRDIVLFNEINATTESDRGGLLDCLDYLSLLESVKQTPLSVYQVLALQACTSAALVPTAFYLHDASIRVGYINKLGYAVTQTIKHMLNSSAKYGNLSTILNISLYYYMTCRFRKALYYVEMAKVKLSRPYVMYFGQVDRTKYNEVVDGMPLSTRMKETYASHVRLHSFNCLRELSVEVKARENKTGIPQLHIPPHVIVSMLSVLCHRENPQKQKEAIYDLQTLITHDDGRYISFHQRNIAWQMLGISQQIHGDLRGALISYQEALKYTDQQIHEIEDATRARIQNVQRALEACS